MPTKKMHVQWKQVKHNIVNYPSKHHSTKHKISDQPTYVLNTILEQTKTLLKIPTTLQGCVQTNLPPTIKQPLDLQIFNATSEHCVSIELTPSAYTTPFYLSEIDRPYPSAWTNGVIRTYSCFRDILVADSIFKFLHSYDITRCIVRQPTMVQTCRPTTAKLMVPSSIIRA